jgi:hypothetical protein
VGLPWSVSRSHPRLQLLPTLRECRSEDWPRPFATPASAPPTLGWSRSFTLRLLTRTFSFHLNCCLPTASARPKADHTHPLITSAPPPPNLRLESLLHSSTARAHILVSSLQLLPTHRERLSEGWPRFPAARQRLLRLLVDARVRAPMIVSGDVHFAELMAARSVPPHSCSFPTPIPRQRITLPPPAAPSPSRPSSIPPACGFGRR